MVGTLDSKAPVRQVLALLVAKPRGRYRSIHRESKDQPLALRLLLAMLRQGFLDKLGRTLMSELISNHGVVIIAGFLVVIDIYGLIICKRFIDRLKSEYRSVWLAMGSPELINPENALQANQLFFFVAFGRFYRLDDAMLNRDGAMMQVIFVVSLVSLGVLFFVLRQ